MTIPSQFLAELIFVFPVEERSTVLGRSIARASDSAARTQEISAYYTLDVFQGVTAQFARANLIQPALFVDFTVSSLRF